MNTDFVDNSFNRFIKRFTIQFPFVLAFVLLFLQSHAQQSALNCNAATPWIPPTFDYTTSFTEELLSFWSNEGNISDNSTSSFATGTVIALGTITYRITDAEQTYSAGNFAGFAIQNGTIGLGLFSGVTINTYLDGGLQESFTASDLLTLDVNLFNSPFQIGFITAEDYDAVEIEINGGGLYIGTVRVYYPVMKKFCAGPALACNTPTAMNNPVFPTQIDYALTGSGDVDFGNVGNPEDAISSSTTDFATLNNLIEDGPVYITIGEQITNYPGGTFVGFDIQNLDILNVSLLSNISITIRRDGVIKQTKSGPSLLIGANALQGGRQIVGFVADSSFDKATLTLNQTGVNLGTTRVYSAIFQTFCAGPPLSCNTQQAITSPTHPLYIEMNHTGFGGPVCALCGVFDAGNVIDADLNNFAQINIGVEALAEGRLSVRNPVTNYQAGTFAGFHIENEVLVGANILSGITIRTFLDGVQMQEVNSTGPLLTVGTELLANQGEQVVGIITSTDFDEVQIELDNLGTVDLGTTKIYNVVLQDFCPATIECEEVYYLSNPTFPVYIDAFRTGLDELACVGSSVVNEQNLLTPSNTDYGLITIAAGVSCAGSIAVADALYTYPAGTTVGFVVEDLELLLQATLFEGITVSTYNNGAFVESRTAGNLLDLNLLILFIGDGPGVYNIGFVATQPFDEVVIEVDPLVSLLYRVRVYSAFVDTNLSEGGSLSCDDTPDAVTDNMSTNEDTPLNGSAQTNDTPSNDGGNEWELVGSNGGAQHGTVTMNPDGTFTYTPNANYNGPDSFTYQICDVNNDCDQATVNITVNSVDDFPLAQDDTAETDEDTPLNDSVQSNDTPSGDGGNTWSLVGANGGAQHGTVTMEPDGDYTYTPDPNYNGPDQFTYQICDADGDCEEAIVSINISSEDDQPSAVNDNVSTDEDTPLNGDVSANDSPSGDGGNVWTLVGPNGGADNGTVVLNPDGTFTYTPDPNSSADDQFTYQVCDVDNDCDIAVVFITVNPVDDLPVAVDDNVSTDEDISLIGSVQTNDTPSGDGGNNWELVGTNGGALHGTVTMDEDGNYTYTPSPDYNGPDSFTYQVCDIDGDCDQAVVSINIDPVNDAPNAVNDTGSTNENEPITIHVNNNDTDVDSPLGEPTIVNQPDNGTLMYNAADSSYTYTPDPGFNGSDVFTYQICDNGTPQLCDQATVTIAVAFESDPAPCNEVVAWVQNAYPVDADGDAFGAAFWTNVDNVENSNTNDFATGTMVLLGELRMTVTDATNDYPAGYFAGYVISSGLLSAGVFSSLSITTYLDGVEQETYQAVDLIGLETFLSDEIQIGFVTTMSFDAIELTIDDALGAGIYHVHHAVIERFCAGPPLSCNVETVMNAPVFPVTIDYANTGADGIEIGEVVDPENAISASTTDYASLICIAGFLDSTFLAVEEQVVDYPANTFVGFDIENLTLLGLDVFNYISITSYLNDIPQQYVTGSLLLAGVPLLSGDGRHTVGFVTNTQVDKVKITIREPVGVTLGTTRVYSAIFRNMCEGPALDCNVFNSITIPEYPVLIDVSHTGLTGVACAGCSVEDVDNVIDANTSNFAQIILDAGVTTTGSISVKKALTPYAANTFVGFRIGNSELVDVEALSGITLTTYLDGVLRESKTNINGLASVSSDLLVNDDEQVVGFVTSMSFNEARISMNNTVTVDVGITRVYELVVSSFCPAEIECDTTYFLSSPDFPVYIDAFLTGPDAIACAACEIVDEENVITESNTDYATITVVANAAGTTSLAVADALYTYPPGTIAGFVIHDLGLLLQANLFQTITISTYNNGQFQESRTAGSLLEVDLLILFINPTAGVHNIGFEATLPFDEIRISVGSLVGVPNIVRVYSAFVDTRASTGGTLFCNDPPVAVDDEETTGENEPVVVPVIENDSDSDDPVQPPVIIDEPEHGDAEVENDSTIVYTPDENFVGQDTFRYEICDPDNLCDTATVIITVEPERDTIIRVIPEDSTFTVCANELTTFTEPATSISICDPPSHGSTPITADCMTYVPENNFNGLDTMCVYTCHPDDPELCDTTIIFITVTPADDSPIAVDDVNTTDEDTPVSGNAQTNDTPSGDGGNVWSLVGVDGGAEHGTVTMNPDGSYLYTPDPDYNGTDVFTYQICDTDSDCDQATVTITINPTDDQPLAVDDNETTNEDTPLNSSVTPNDTPSPDGGNVWNVTIQPDHGDVVMDPDGSYTYTPDPNYNGPDVFTYEVCDVDGDCSTATVTINVDPVDDQPIAEDDTETTDEDTPIVSTVATNDTPSPDGGNTWTVTVQPDHGDVVMDPDGSYTYTPDPDYNGPDQFTYQICDVDGDCESAVVDITVGPIDDQPVAENDAESAPEDTPINSTVVSNDTPSGDGGNEWSLVTPNGGALHGDVTMNPDGSYTYTPDLNYSGPDQFTYEVCDVDGDCDQAVVNITITSVCETLNVQVMLEGPFDSLASNMTTVLNYYHILPGQDPGESTDPFAAALGVPTPVGQPYDIAPWNYNGTEGDIYGDPGTNPGSIPYPSTVTDWVLVSVRNDILNPATEIWKCAGLLHSNGQVEFPPGCPCLELGTTPVYILVEHRNHLGVASNPATPNATTVGYNFKTTDSWKFGLGSPQEVTQKLINGVYCMYAANSEQVSSRTDIVSPDEAIWLQHNSLIYTYLLGDHSLNGDVNSVDEAFWLDNVSLFNFIPY